MSHSQEIFDRVATHLLQQRNKSLMPNGYHCAYRGRGGQSCAAGCLITDEHYDPKLEGLSASCSSVKQAITASLGYDLTPEEFKLIDALQVIHDITPAADWRDELAVYARRANLTMVSA